MANRRKHMNDHDLQADVQKIKMALLDTAYDVRGKAEEIFNDSIDDVKERSSMLKDNVADYTTKKPFYSLGVALLVGAAIGFLMRK